MHDRISIERQVQERLSIEQKAEQLIAIRKRNNWDIGECAHRAAKERNYTDEETSVVIFKGEINRSTIQRCRAIYERFSNGYRFDDLRWQHYRNAIQWEDGENWLELARDHDWTATEMMARYNANSANVDTVGCTELEVVEDLKSASEESDPVVERSRKKVRDHVRGLRGHLGNLGYAGEYDNALEYFDRLGSERIVV